MATPNTVKDEDMRRALELLSALYALRLESTARLLRTSINKYALERATQRELYQTMLTCVTAASDVLTANYTGWLAGSGIRYVTSG